MTYSVSAFSDHAEQLGANPVKVAVFDDACAALQADATVEEVKELVDETARPPPSPTPSSTAPGDGAAEHAEKAASGGQEAHTEGASGKRVSRCVFFPSQ